MDKTFKKRRTYEIIAEDLKQQILSGELKSGNLLPSVQELGSHYQVSRSTVREALSALKIMRFIETKQGEGSKVKKIDPEDIGIPDFHDELVSERTLIELMEARKAIELSNVRLAAKGRTEEDLIKLQEILNKMELNLLSDSKEESQKLDMSFHLVISQATHNSIMTRLLQTISTPLETAMQEIRRVSYSDKDFSKAIFKEHHDIFHAILNKDETNAQKQMSNHLDHFEEQLYKYVRTKFH
ncbi:FadR/GntR family transcriptional regulator [Salipaludibacillus sp. CF4.18]|uniref:FadR/GntR family transcriptional regulator n=1 Tax=Salipaludibacillus sp. CF4.18 TaxID=3373081 RepID=UPI003EE6EE32